MQSYKSLFPLIDDPANYFYSKLKTLFISDYENDIKIFKLNRIKRRIEVKTKFANNIIIKNYDIRKLQKENFKDKFVYLSLLFTSTQVNTESTIGGELVPVDLNNFKFENIKTPLSNGYIGISDYGFIFTDYDPASSNEVKILERTLIGGTKTYLFIGVPLGVNKIQTNTNYSSDLYDIKRNFILDEYKETHLSVYRPIIGRRLFVDESTSISSWKLYDIDSNLSETLIDSSDNEPNYSNNSEKWIPNYGPMITPINGLVTFRSNMTNNRYNFYVVDKNYEYMGSSGDEEAIRINIKDKGKFNNFLENAFLSETENSGMSMKELLNIMRRKDDNLSLKVENAALVLSYIFNINLRYFLYPVFEQSVRPIIWKNDIDTNYSTKIYREYLTQDPIYQNIIEIGEDSPDDEVKSFYNNDLTNNLVSAELSDTTLYPSQVQDSIPVFLINKPLQNSMGYSWLSPFDKQRKLYSQYIEFLIDSLNYTGQALGGGIGYINDLGAISRLFDHAKFSILLQRKNPFLSADSFINDLNDRNPRMTYSYLSNYTINVYYIPQTSGIDNNGVMLSDIYGNSNENNYLFNEILCVSKYISVSDEYGVYTNSEIADFNLELYKNNENKLMIRTGSVQYTVNAGLIHSIVVISGTLQQQVL